MQNQNLINLFTRHHSDSRALFINSSLFTFYYCLNTLCN